jgi:nicotinate-nucleotide adenylyltransferase
MKRRVGILGGTFDPIHQGHLDVGTAAQAALRLSPLLVMPSHVPPHRPPPVASAFHRFAMIALAVADRPDWQASDIELTRPEATFTAATLDRLHAQGFQPTELFFLVGADAFKDITTWRDYTRVLDGAHFVVVSRHGHPVNDLVHKLPAVAHRIVSAAADDLLDTAPRIVLLDADTADVSATDIRQRLREGISVEGMLPQSVARHLIQHHLYTSTPGNEDHHYQRHVELREHHHQAEHHEDEEQAALRAANRLHGKS